MSAKNGRPLRNSVLATKVARVEPHRASTVAMAVRARSAEGTTALQKLGQKIHSTIEPSMEKRSEVSSLSIIVLARRAPAVQD